MVMTKGVTATQLSWQTYAKYCRVKWLPDLLEFIKDESLDAPEWVRAWSPIFLINVRCPCFSVSSVKWKRARERSAAIWSKMITRRMTSSSPGHAIPYSSSCFYCSSVEAGWVFHQAYTFDDTNARLVNRSMPASELGSEVRHRGV